MYLKILIFEGKFDVFIKKNVQRQKNKPNLTVSMKRDEIELLSWVSDRIDNY